VNNSIKDSFSIIKDPRLERKRLHSLIDILVLTICAMLSGSEGYTAIEAFGHNKKKWLKGVIPPFITEVKSRRLNLFQLVSWWHTTNR